MGDKLLELQGIFMTVISGSGHRKLQASSKRSLTVLWEQGEGAANATAQGLERNAGKNLQVLVLSSFHLEWLAAKDGGKGVDAFKAPLLEALTKLVISSKTKTEPVFLTVSYFL